MWMLVEDSPQQKCLTLEQIEEEFAFNHVVLDRMGAETAPLRNVQELRMLDHYYWVFEKVFQESRLVSVILVNKAMDDMIV